MEMSVCFSWALDPHIINLNFHRETQRKIDVNRAQASFNAMQDEGFSGEQSFLTDEEIDYQDRPS